LCRQSTERSTGRGGRLAPPRAPPLTVSAKIIASRYTPLRFVLLPPFDESPSNIQIVSKHSLKLVEICYLKKIILDAGSSFRDVKTIFIDLFISMREKLGSSLFGLAHKRKLSI